MSPKATVVPALMVWLAAAASPAPAQTPKEDLEHFVGVVCKGGPVLPEPQQAGYGEKAWPVEAGKIAVVPGRKASTLEGRVARELVQRIDAFLGKIGAAEMRSESGSLSRYDLVIALGLAETNRFLSTRMKRLGLDPPAEYPGREGYRIECLTERDRNVVLCLGFDERGLYYAAESAIQLLHRDGDAFLFRPAKIVDWPAYDLRCGQIAGWGALPGKPEGYTREDLAGMMRAVRWLGTAKFNVVDISYPHYQDGRSWRTPREDYVRHVEETARWASAHGLSTMQLVNPYYGKRGPYHGQRSKIFAHMGEDIDILAKCFRISLDAGGDMIMLCLDDFCPDAWPPYKFTNDEDAKRFGNHAEASVHLVTELKKRLSKARPNLKIVLCPPWYSDAMVDKMGADLPHAALLGKKLPKDVPIVWTGPEVRSLNITPANVEKWRKYTGRERMLLWDNTFYERRYNGKHFGTNYLFDLWETSYPEDFHKVAEGVHINNAYFDEISMTGMMDVGNYLWNPKAYDPLKSLQRCIALTCGKPAVGPILDYRETFYNLFRVIQPKNSNAAQAVLKMKEGGKSHFKKHFPRLVPCFEKIEKTCENKRVLAELRELTEFYKQVNAKLAIAGE